MAEHHRLAAAAANASKRMRLVSLTCVVCGSLFETTADRQSAKTCGTECGRQHRNQYNQRWNEQNRERVRASKRSENMSDRAREGVRRRSIRAAERRRAKEHPRVLKRCRCGKLFAPRSSLQSFCSLDCRRAASNAMARAARAADEGRREKENRSRREYARRRYLNSAEYRERQKAKRKREWLTDPERYADKVWEYSIRKKYGENIHPDLRLLLEEQRRLYQDLAVEPPNACRVCGVQIRRRNVLCAGVPCQVEYARWRGQQLRATRETSKCITAPAV